MNEFRKAFVQATAVRKRYQESDLNFRELAEEFDLSLSYVHALVRNEKVTDPGYVDVRGDIEKYAKMKRAREIRRLHARGMSMSDIARQYGINVSSVHNIVHYRYHKE